MKQTEELEVLARRALVENFNLVRSLRMGLGRPSNWEGHSVGHYIEAQGDVLELSKPFPADLKRGHLISPTTNLMDSTSAIRTDLAGIRAIAVTTVESWRTPEIRSRHILHHWARRIDGPVFASVAIERQPWLSTWWVITATTCERVGLDAGECVPLTATGGGRG